MKVKINSLVDERVGEVIYDQESDAFQMREVDDPEGEWIIITLTGNEIKMMAAIRQHYVPWGH